MLAACPAQTASLATHSEPGPVAEWGQNPKIHSPAAGCSGGEGPEEELREQPRARSYLADDGCWWEWKGQGAELLAQLQHGATLLAEGKDLAYSSTGKC